MPATIIKQITVGSNTYNIRGYFYGTCSTGASNAAKSVVCTQFTASNLEAGSLVIVAFDNENSADSPTLSVNSTTAKDIYFQGTQITTGDEKSLLVGVCIFIYDGTHWNLVGGGGGGEYEATVVSVSSEILHITNGVQTNEGTEY